MMLNFYHAVIDLNICSIHDTVRERNDNVEANLFQNKS